MEHDEKPLPIDIRTLGQLAEKVWLFGFCTRVDFILVGYDIIGGNFVV